MTDRQVEGVNLDDLEEIYKKFEDAVTAALAAAMRASLKGGALAAESVAQVSLDDLNVIPGQWARQVPALADHLTEIYVKSADMQADAFVRAGGVVTEELAQSVTTEVAKAVRRFTSEHAATIDYLASASNRLVGIGDDLWADARSELLLGMDAGDSVPQLAKRVRESTGVTDKRARVIARSEAVSASNGGSIAFMRSTGEVADKRWLNHVDARTRESHLAAGGQTVPIDAKFVVGGALLDHPGDPNGPPSETIQCRCVCEWILTSESATAQPADTGDTLAASAQTEDSMPINDPPPSGATATFTPVPIQYNGDYEADMKRLADNGFLEYPPQIDALVAAMDPVSSAPWEGVVCVENEVTGDHREFVGLTWVQPPMALRWNIVESHGGIPQTQAVLIGRCDSLERRGDEIWGRGVINLAIPEGAKAAGQMGTRERPGFLSGISVDADDPTNGLIEVVFPAGCADTAPESMTEADAMRCMEPERVIYHDARIRAMTLTDIPAFARAQVYLTSTDVIAPGNMPANMPVEEMAMAASIDVNEPTMADIVESLTAAAHQVTIEDVPPRWFFDEPADMPEIGGISVSADGRFFGYVAPVGVAHRGIEKRTTVPLRNVDYSRWATRARAVANEDGTITHIATGPITMGCNHADTRTNSGAVAREHYENSCSIVATACIGENRNGVWIAGALMPDITAAQVARILACQLSGDWRAHKERPGQREFAGALLVSVPGFPVANRGARVSMQGDALVASAVPVHFARPEADYCDCASVVDHVMRVESEEGSVKVAAADILAAKVGRDRVSRAAELTKMVRS